MDVLACLLTEGDSRLVEARALAEALHLPLNPASTEGFSFVLKMTSSGELRLEDREGRHLEIDFNSDQVNYHRKGLRGKNELLAKALGWAKGARRVLDLSAGLGIDAIFMVHLGFRVLAVERSPLLFALLQRALQRAPDLQKNLKFVWADSGRYLEDAAHLQEIEAIFFDPMYPHKKKTALPKQEMVLFRELVGHDEDAAQVLEKALASSVPRVVVKRPLGAEPLLPGVRHSFEGKVVRYDVYMR